MSRRSRSSPPRASVTSTAELPCSVTPTVANRCAATALVRGWEPEGRRPHFPATVTAGGFQLPSRIDGAVSFGQYSRIMRMNSPLGAGSQLASLSLPGDSFWMMRSSEPSALYCRVLRGLTVYLFSGLSTKKYAESYMVIDQKALTGGVWPGGKCTVYLFAPLYLLP